MTRADLSNVVYRMHGGLSRRDSALVIDRLIDTIRKVLLDGGRVQISGFGSFDVVRRRARKGRNPQTGDVIAIESRNSLVFRPSKTLLDALNPG